MSCIVVNLVYLRPDNTPYRKTLVFDQDREQDGIVISPEENEVIMWGVSRKLIKVEKRNDIPKIISFVESIYADDLKVFDFHDYDVKPYTVEGDQEYALHDRRPIKVPGFPL